MRRASCCLPFLAVLFAASLALAQETMPPISVGGDQSATRTANGQTIEVIADGVSVTVNFFTVSSTTVSGAALRTSTGTTSGTVTIRWLTYGRSVTLSLSPATPEVPFTMEGGDIDRRTDQQLSEP